MTFVDTRGSGLDAASIDGDEFTLSGPGVNTGVLRGTATLVSGTSYRYMFDGELAVGDVDVNFVAGTWQDNAGNVNVAETETFTVLPVPAASPE